MQAITYLVANVTVGICTLPFVGWFPTTPTHPMVVKLKELSEGELVMWDDEIGDSTALVYTPPEDRLWNSQ